MLIAVWVEEYDRARASTNRVVPLLRASGALSPLPHAPSVASELEFRTGAWSAALAAASEAVEVASEVGQRGTLAYSLVTLGRVEAGLGRERSCYEHVESAAQLADRFRVGSIHTYAGAALGLLELGLSRPERAREHLEPLDELTARQGLAEPGCVCWQPDYVESLIRLGELEAAGRALERLEREASAVNRTWALAAVERYRGLMAAEAEFEKHFARALDLHALTPTPFDLARTELCLGERLRRANRRSAARESLTRAKERFRRLGAEPWAAKAEQELAAMGLRSAAPGPAGVAHALHDVLSTQELQVALAVAQGKTNKEAAASLFVSPKTIEFHLGQIYRKLSIRSRTQLARRLEQESQPG